MTLLEKLSGKRIIFFSVQTFNLEKEIIRKLEEYRAEVEYYDERPANNNFTKGIIRIKRSLYQRKIDAYYKKILRNTESNQYDFLFVNRGEVVPEFFLEAFKKNNPECEFVFYTWDSFANHGHPTKILKFFDFKATFDPEDALKYKLTFRPLFFLDGYEKLKTNAAKKYDYDLLFLGTAHSDRYRISNKVVDWCARHNLKAFCYYYMHGKWVYFYKKLFDASFQEFDFKKLSFTSLTREEILQLYKRSKVVLDINHPGQKGLTMRTFEAIGAGKKMITTNAQVKKYPFYKEENILVIDREEINLEKGFFEKDYAALEPELYEKLSMSGWLSDIFVRDNPEFWADYVLKSN